ncbi:type II toxin-antitoxin system RelE/ParE family toxin [Micromonospora sp. NPDC049891]|uniref:type II toxin-antitoxin system RelE family toxin n=1 Tax=Micromonospora sp. NPDC049891 TaxID=3155655 RepID=UPI0033D00A2D
MPELSRRAQKDLDDLPAALRNRAETIIARLDREPGLGKKLLGPLAGVRSARLGRSHRILFRMTDEGAFVLTVAQRRDAYK